MKIYFTWEGEQTETRFSLSFTFQFLEIISFYTEKINQTKRLLQYVYKCTYMN